MEKFIHSFDHIQTWQLFLWVLLWMSFSAVLENIMPLFTLKYKRLKHAAVNITFLLTTAIVNFLVSMITTGVYMWVSHHQFGLYYVMEIPLWAKLIVSILLLDFIGMYCSHYFLHRFKWMWKFHMVHHSDRHVDVTTGTRHHPGDWLIREAFALLAIVLTGSPIAFYFIFRFCNVIFTYLTHANILVPAKIDRIISWVFVTPNMHKFHHHFERPWTDTNFGNIFSIWDRLLGTYVYDNVRKVHYGLDVLEGKPDDNVLKQITLPFDRSIKTDEHTLF